VALVRAGFFERYANKIEFGAPSGCWLWAGWNNGRGYGRIEVKGKYRKAHREAYEAIHGEGSANGWQVRHKCDTPECVNPDHLEIGTNADNVRDRQKRGRGFVPRFKGERCWNAKLTAEDIMAIRKNYVFRHPEFGGAALARRFGVDQTLVSAIVRKKAWRHI